MRLLARALMACMVIWMSCIDKVDISLPPAELPVIIEGLVTDQDERYRVKISRAFPADGNFYRPAGIDSATVVIADDLGNQHVLADSGKGIYYTNPAIMRGFVGRSYTLFVDLLNGAHYESIPQRMVPAGSVDSIFYEVVERTNKNKDIDEHGLNVYINARAATGSSLRLRWVFNGTYEIRTDPALVFHVDPITLERVPGSCGTPCACCTCYVSETEEQPIVIDNTFLGSTDLNRVFMKYIPVNNFTFNQKYKVRITQMELSQEVYDFYSAIKGQMENANSLFQPPYFELKGNVSSTNSQEPVIGVFSAVAVAKRSINIIPGDFGLSISSSVIPGNCRVVVANSSLTPPPDW